MSRIIYIYQVKHLIGVLCLFLVYGTIYAQTPLDSIVVTGQMKNSTVDLSVQKVKVIDRIKMDKMGAVSLRDVLTNELNFRITQDAVLGSRISMQGLSGSQVKILMDGVPVIGRLDGNIDLNQINLNNIERIEIIEGPMSVIYGTDASAGVINLITKKNSKNLYDINANIYHDSKGNYNYDFGGTTKIKKSFLGISVGRYLFDGWDPNEDRYKRQMQWKPKEQYFTNIYYNFNTGKTTHRIAANYYREFLLSLGSPNVTPFDAKGIDDHFITNRSQLIWQADRKIGKRGALSFLNSYSFYQRKRNEYVKDLVSGDQILSANKENQDTTKFALIQLRGSYIRQNKKGNYTSQFGYDINSDHAAGKKFGGAKNYINDYALFFNNEYKPTKKLDIKVGFRFVYNTRFTVPVTPMFGMRYQLNKNNVIRFSASKGFRAPTLKELTFMFVDANHIVLGNDSLKAERSGNMQFNYSYTKPLKNDRSFKIDVSTFYNRLSNMITLLQLDATTNLNKYVNIDKFSSKGSTLQVAYYSPKFTIRTGVSRTGLNNYFNQTNKFFYYHEINFNADYKFKKYNSSVSFFYKVNGKQQKYVYDENNNIAVAYINPWEWMDVSFNKKFTKQHIQFVAGIKNLMNVTSVNSTLKDGAHTQSGQSPVGMGRIFFITFKYDFSKMLKS